MKNSEHHTIALSTASRAQLEPGPHSTKLFGVWQPRGPETLSGLVVRKLRLTLAPPQSAVTAHAGQ
ncbi:MAG: hypothetical protein WAO00_10935 [Chthoniobacterales bacterium]